MSEIRGGTWRYGTGGGEEGTNEGRNSIRKKGVTVIITVTVVFNLMRYILFYSILPREPRHSGLETGRHGGEGVEIETENNNNNTRPPTSRGGGLYCSE